MEQSNVLPDKDDYIVVYEGKGNSGTGVMSWHDFGTAAKFVEEREQDDWKGLKIIAEGVPRESAIDMCKKSTMPADTFFVSRTAHVESGSTLVFEGV